MTLGFALILTAVAMLAGLIAHRETMNETEVGVVNPAHRVLFISSYNPNYFSYDEQQKGLEEALYPADVDYDVVYMDAKKHPEESDLDDFREFFKNRYGDCSAYEAVITADDDALHFMLDNRDELKVNAPIVFFGINDYDFAVKAVKEPGVTGYFEGDFVNETVDLANSLFPNASGYVAMHDESAAGTADVNGFYQAAALYPKKRFSELNTAEMTDKELKAKLENITQGNILLFMTSYADSEGNQYSLENRTDSIIKHCHVPVFRNYMGSEGSGIFGGVSLNMQAQAYEAGQTAIEIMNGADPSVFPLGTQTESRTWVDWNVMEKYGISESQIPADAVFINRPESFLEKYGNILPVVVVILLALTLLIIAARCSVAVGRINNAELKESQDILEKSREVLIYSTEHDEFLDLLNRRTATEYLRKNLTMKSEFSVIMADLDGFNNINETYGHSMADELLIEIAAQLRDTADREGWIAARYGGDEFLIMIPNRKLTATSAEVEILLEIFRTQAKVGDEVLGVSTSLGISVSDGETSTDQHILNAEMALKEAKLRGKNCAFIYAEEMKARAKEENVIRGKLLEAFDNDGFYMLYQPQIDSDTLELHGFEALVRMKEPGMYPGKFIPVAEKSGWIWRIGRITTQLVIEQLVKWREEGRELKPVSINFSSNQLGDSGYLDFLADLLVKHNIPADLIEIEITEGIFLGRSAEAEELFRRFKKLGITLLMDDFGTGYSSLGYLTYIPVDVIKLDKSLVDAYLVEGKDLFISDVIKLVHDLGKKMIIEGVEHKWQYERLREFGADTIQGYYFSKPIPAEEAIVFKASVE